MKNMTFVLGTCLTLALGAPALLGQARRAEPAAAAETRAVVQDRREDVRDRREDVRDRTEDVRDRREDVRDARRDGGPADRREDRRDVREDRRDKREDRRDRIEDRIDRNPQLRDRLNDLLPPNTTMADALLGFENQGQFIAALHVSQNLVIPFADLQARMTDGEMSLGEAIHDLRPEMPERTVKEETRRAEQQAKQTEREPK